MLKHNNNNNTAKKLYTFSTISKLMASLSESNSNNTMEVHREI